MPLLHPQFPKVNPAALRHGIWGNTWRQWGEAPCSASPVLPCGDVPALCHCRCKVSAANRAGATAGLILLAFSALYVVLAGFTTGMLFAALGIRQDIYR